MPNNPKPKATTEVNMKSKFTPQDFRILLNSLYSIFEGVIRSENYQNFTNSQHAKALKFNLVDALQALYQTEEAYAQQQKFED